MKKFITVCACVAAILLCVLIGSLIGKGLAGRYNLSLADSSSTASSAASAETTSASAEAVSFSLPVPEGFSAAEEPDMDEAWLHADSSEILLKKYDITSFAGGMGTMTEDILLNILQSGYQAEYDMTPEFSVSDYCEKPAGGCSGYYLDVNVKTHRGDEEYRQILYAADTGGGEMYLWSFTDESGTGAHMDAFNAAIDGITPEYADT